VPEKTNLDKRRKKTRSSESKQQKDIQQSEPVIHRCNKIKVITRTSIPGLKLAFGLYILFLSVINKLSASNFELSIKIRSGRLYPIITLQTKVSRSVCLGLVFIIESKRDEGSQTITVSLCSSCTRSVFCPPAMEKGTNLYYN
jgi:hypothetical protein